MDNLLAKYRDVIVYLVFGVLTTAVNYIVYLPCYNVLGLSGSASNAIAWVVAVAFAYLTISLSCSEATTGLQRL